MRLVLKPKSWTTQRLDALTKANDWFSNPKAGLPSPKNWYQSLHQNAAFQLNKRRRTSYDIQTLTLAHQQLDNQTQATGTLTRVDIYSQLDNQSTHTRTNPRSWYQLQHPNDVAPTYRNAVVCPQQAKSSSWIQTHYQLSLNTTHPDFTKTTAFRNLALRKHATTGFYHRPAFTSKKTQNHKTSRIAKTD
ncbi:hypothetical protein F511_33375 [Dorcoceras hygrometricum]|uniref:Uncharacterized protein n=1 Tax=Dorcoceras hygrometricum TaxID=472368 RepID=A0A2Z7CM86_9LAMI|nr:hypothetical protein F511_33375 [Dorcoceras hygrometricum]